LERVIVFSTCAKKSEATKIASAVLKQRLAACVNILPISSFYWWKGKIRSDSEILLIIKTRSELFGKLQARILEINSYEVPEITCVRIIGGLPAYLRWIDKETKAKIARVTSKGRRSSRNA